MQNISQVRHEDERKSKLSTDFLVKWFYEKDCNNFEIVTDKQRQVQGIDSIFQYNGFIYKCDEKAATDYINSDRGPLGTFSMELSSLNRYGSNLHLGWLLSSECVNDSYLFLWIDKADNKRLTNINEIQEAEMALVQKVKILEYLQSKGQDVSVMMKTQEYIRENPLNESIRGNIRRYGYKYCFSQQKAEQPVNILVPRDVLVSIADCTKKYHRD